MEVQITDPHWWTWRDCEGSVLGFRLGCSSQTLRLPLRELGYSLTLTFLAHQHELHGVLMDEFLISEGSSGLRNVNLVRTVWLLVYDVFLHLPLLIELTKLLALHGYSGYIWHDRELVGSDGAIS